jgi:hypothetical protein
VLRQWTRSPPLGWGRGANNMATILGNGTLGNISLSVRALIETPDAGYEPAAPPYVEVGLNGGSGSARESGPSAFYRADADADTLWFNETAWGCKIAANPAVCAEALRPRHVARDHVRGAAVGRARYADHDCDARRRAPLQRHGESREKWRDGRVRDAAHGRAPRHVRRPRAHDECLFIEMIFYINQQVPRDATRAHGVKFIKQQAPPAAREFHAFATT